VGRGPWAVPAGVGRAWAGGVRARRAAAGGVCRGWPREAEPERAAAGRAWPAHEAAVCVAATREPAAGKAAATRAGV
jgi:hypothetical protein